MDKTEHTVEPSMAVSRDEAITAPVVVAELMEASETIAPTEAQPTDEAPPADASADTADHSDAQGTEDFDLTNGDVPAPEAPSAEAENLASLRQALDQAVTAAVSAAVAEAVEAAVSSAVARMREQMSTEIGAKAEEDLMAHIRACGQRPHENGVQGAGGVRMHPAVDRLTRKDRAALAERAAHGETVRL